VVCGQITGNRAFLDCAGELLEQINSLNYKKITQTVSSDTEYAGNFVYSKYRQKQYTGKVAEKGGAE
jgi:hypothetical protein